MSDGRGWFEREGEVKNSECSEVGVVDKGVAWCCATANRCMTKQPATVSRPWPSHSVIGGR